MFLIELSIFMVIGSIVLFLAVNPIYTINDKLDSILIDVSNGIVMTFFSLYCIGASSLS